MARSKKWSKGIMLRTGKLGGPGYTTLSWPERRYVLDRAVKQYGYRSMLGSIRFLLNIGAGRKNEKIRRNLQKDWDYLVKWYGGIGAFGPRKPARVQARRGRISLDSLIRKVRRAA